MELYSQHRQFVTSTWLLLLARFGFALQAGLLVLLFAVLWPRGYRWLFKWWTVSFLSATGWLIVTAWTGILLAAFMKCDACGRRPTIVWILDTRSPTLARMGSGPSGTSSPRRSSAAGSFNVHIASASSH